MNVYFKIAQLFTEQSMRVGNNCHLLPCGQWALKIIGSYGSGMSFS